MVQCCFTSTETIRLVRTDSPGRPPRLLLGTNCDQCINMVQCCFTSTETIRLVRTDSPGRPPRLLFGTNCDQCINMVQCCFTSTETVRLVRTDSPGRPPRLSHSNFVRVVLWWRLLELVLNNTVCLEDFFFSSPDLLYYFSLDPFYSSSWHDFVSGIIYCYF